MTSHSVIEEKYQSLGLFDNRLNNLYDLFRAHNINVMEIPGFIDLDTANRELFSNFIINFYNMQGLEARESLQPTGINYVADTTYFATDPMDGMLTESYREIIAIFDKSDNNTQLLHSYVEEKYKGLPCQETVVEKYLRFEFVESGKPSWLHVAGEYEWY